MQKQDNVLLPTTSSFVHHRIKNKNTNKNCIDPQTEYIRISSLVLPFSENQKQIKSIIVQVT